MASAAIDAIAWVLGSAYITLLGLANQASGILFVGGAIAGGIREIAYKIPGIITGLAQLKVALQRLGDGIDIYSLIPQSIRDLANFAYQLISFISDPLPKIRQYLHWIYPYLVDFLNNPISWIVNIVRTLTGIPIQLFTNAVGFIMDIVNVALGVLLAFKANPAGFISGIIDQVFPILRIISGNPFAWVENLLASRFPFLRAFFSDPLGYIVETFITGLENLLEKYRDRLVRLFEAVLNRIF